MFFARVHPYSIDVLMKLEKFLDIFWPLISQKELFERLREVKLKQRQTKFSAFFNIVWYIETIIVNDTTYAAPLKIPYEPIWVYVLN